MSFELPSVITKERLCVHASPGPQSERNVLSTGGFEILSARFVSLHCGENYVKCYYLKSSLHTCLVIPQSSAVLSILHKLASKFSKNKVLFRHQFPSHDYNFVKENESDT